MFCQESYPPMTQNQYVGGQVSSSSRIDYIFLTSLLYTFVKSTWTEVFPNSDHKLLICILHSQKLLSSTSSWKKILPCNVSGWRFSKDFNLALKPVLKNYNLSNWELLKSKLISDLCHSQSQRLFSYCAKLKKSLKQAHIS